MLNKLSLFLSGFLFKPTKDQKENNCNTLLSFFCQGIKFNSVVSAVLAPHWAP